MDEEEEVETLSAYLAITYYKLNELEKSFPFFVDAAKKGEECVNLFYEFCPEAKDNPFFSELGYYYYNEEDIE